MDQSFNEHDKEVMTRLAASRQELKKNPYRPLYHFAAAEGAMNDPNGLCFWKGKWHLFFQGGSPEATQPSWGHAVSTDLIHWQDLPYAIEPGPELASYSGATWVEEDRVIAMYHGVNLGNMIAVSGETDLIHWEKLTNNAVIAQPCPFFTTTNGTETICGQKAPAGAINMVYDPCIWKKDDCYYSLSGGAMKDGSATTRVRTAFLYRSKDLIHWEYLHSFIEGDIYGRPGDDCGCPYFVPIGDQYMLLHFSHRGTSHYLIGDYDKKRDKFIVRTGGDFGFGPTFPGGLLAPSAFPDGNGGVMAIFNVASGLYTPENAAQQIMSENPDKAGEVLAAVRAVPANNHVIGQDVPFSQKNNPDTPYFEAAGTVFKDMDKGNALLKQFRTLFHQLMLPMGMRHMLPDGLVGLFCLMMVIFMVSSDDSRIYSACITITQDCVLPFCKEDLSPKAHIRLIRIVSIGVGLVFLAGSYFMSQLDYIQLFVTIMCSMWLGGCGPVILGGLYSRFGTVAGAFTSLITGMLMSVSGILLQRNWPDYVYPWLEQHGWAAPVGKFLETVSRPLHPWVVWKMDPVDFPINSYEIYFITMIVSLVLYIAVSFLTCKEPFNLDRMLHRGIYAADGSAKPASPWTWQNLWSKLIGITPEYSRGDRMIAWSVFCYSIVFKFFIAFVLVLIWNKFSPWPVKWWSWYFLVVFVLVPGLAAAVSTVWFGVGGILDLRKMFRDLKERVDNPLDNGMVDGHVSLTDREAFAEVEKANTGK